MNNMTALMWLITFAIASKRADGFWGEYRSWMNTRTTTPPGCFTNGKFYPPGVMISSGRQGNWCYWQMCDRDGNLLAADDFNCGSTTPPPTTTEPTRPPGCVYNGKHYAPGATISSGKQENWCYWLKCGTDGGLIAADDFNCDPTTSPSPTTMPPMPGCIYEGKHYAPGSTISSGQSGNWCYSSVCGDDGQVIDADDWNCAMIPSTNEGSGSGNLIV